MLRRRRLRFPIAVALLLAGCDAGVHTFPPVPTGCGPARDRSCADLHAARCAAAGVDGPIALDGAHDPWNVFFDGTTLASWTYGGTVRRYDAEGLFLDARAGIAELVDVAHGFAGVDGPTELGGHFVAHRYDAAFDELVRRDVGSDMRMSFFGHDDELIAITPSGVRMYDATLSQRFVAPRLAFVDVNEVAWTGTAYAAGTIGGVYGEQVQSVTEDGVTSAVVTPPMGFVNVAVVGPGPAGGFYVRAFQNPGGRQVLYAVDARGTRRGEPLDVTDANVFATTTDGTTATLWEARGGTPSVTLSRVLLDADAQVIGSAPDITFAASGVDGLRVRSDGDSTLVWFASPHTVTALGQVYVVRPCD